MGLFGKSRYERQCEAFDRQMEIYRGQQEEYQRQFEAYIVREQEAERQRAEARRQIEETARLWEQKQSDNAEWAARLLDRCETLAQRLEKLLERWEARDGG